MFILQISPASGAGGPPKTPTQLPQTWNALLGQLNSNYIPGDGSFHMPAVSTDRKQDLQTLSKVQLGFLRSLNSVQQNAINTYYDRLTNPER